MAYKIHCSWLDADIQGLWSIMAKTQTPKACKMIALSPENSQKGHNSTYFWGSGNCSKEYASKEPRRSPTNGRAKNGRFASRNVPAAPACQLGATPLVRRPKIVSWDPGFGFRLLPRATHAPSDGGLRQTPNHPLIWGRFRGGIISGGENRKPYCTVGATCIMFIIKGVGRFIIKMV